MNRAQTDINNNVEGNHASTNAIIERHQQAINNNLDNKIRSFRRQKYKLGKCKTKKKNNLIAKLYTTAKLTTFRANSAGAQLSVSPAFEKTPDIRHTKYMSKFRGKKIDLSPALVLSPETKEIGTQTSLPAKMSILDQSDIICDDQILLMDVNARLNAKLQKTRESAKQYTGVSQRLEQSLHELR